jgi:hypothetical protein
MVKKSKFLTILLSALFLFGCGGNSSSTTGSYASQDSFNAKEEAAEAINYEDEDFNSSAYVATNEYDAETNTFNGKKIIYSADLSLETKDYKKSVSEINEVFKKYNVMIANSSENDNSSDWYDSKSRGTYSYRSSNWTVKVPVQNFNDFMNSFGTDTTHVVSKNVYSNDVTKTYTDNETRIKSLNVQEERLLEMLKTAETVSDMLEIEDRLATVRYEKEALVNNNSSIDYDVQFSDVNINLRTVNSYTPEKISFGDRVKESFQLAFANFSSWLQDRFIKVIYMLPYLLLAALIFVIFNIVRLILGKKWLHFHEIVKWVYQVKYMALNNQMKTSGFKIFLSIIVSILFFSLFIYLFF